MKVDVKQIAKLPANVLAKEARLFLIFSYLGIWMCLPVMSMMDLKASTPVLDLIDDIYLIQLYFVVWFFYDNYLVCNSTFDLFFGKKIWLMSFNLQIGLLF